MSEHLDWFDQLDVDGLVSQPTQRSSDGFDSYGPGYDLPATQIAGTLEETEHAGDALGYPVSGAPPVSRLWYEAEAHLESEGYIDSESGWAIGTTVSEPRDEPAGTVIFSDDGSARGIVGNNGHLIVRATLTRQMTDAESVENVQSWAAALLRSLAGRDITVRQAYTEISWMAHNIVRRRGPVIHTRWSGSDTLNDRTDPAVSGGEPPPQA